jgi:cell shape-determining protein MreC
MAVKQKMIRTTSVAEWQKMAFLIAFALVADIAGFSRFITGAFYGAVTPVRQVFVRIAGAGYSVWRDAENLPKAAEKIQDLELRLAGATVSLAELETLRKENEELRFLLENTDRTDERSVIASPIVAFSRPALAVGTARGVQIGAVVLSRNILLGQVTEVSEYESRVVLLSETASQPVLAKTSSGVAGIIVGDGRRVMLTEVSKEQTLAVGDSVMTVGQPQIEQNLLIGRVARVFNEPVASAQSAIIQQPTTFFETPVVEVR